MPDTKPLTLEEIKQIEAIPMLFILGKSRSGTSLLQNLLNAHPEVSGGPESRFAQIFYPYFKHIKKWKKSDIIGFAEKLYMEPLFTNLWHIDKNRLIQILLSTKEMVSYSLLCKIVYSQIQKGKKHLLYFSDKNPEYILFINTILKIFPEAKFIHIVREPRDNLYSQILSFKEKNTKFRAYQWLSYNSIVEKKKKDEPEKYLTILYENLVSDTVETMKKVSGFLGVSFDIKMTKNIPPEWLNSHPESMTTIEKNKMIHTSLLKPVNISNVGKWKTQMSLYDQTLIEIITGDFAKKIYGYDIDSNRVAKQIKISLLTLMWGKFLYYTWQTFTQLKAKSFRFNLFYSKLKRKLTKVPVWDYF